ncbi:hypothetical protein SFRURICE_015377 [Spodoptera frugiperda]|uniref:SFRICE_018828 n=1 Tax=Spodoptera frugiperda TaxID=7108 RepID=A0A2H1WAW5_SPOFR|nr:hypothetical protein SFRURICE_015377 [Spodoptera frugiperda]
MVILFRLHITLVLELVKARFWDRCMLFALMVNDLEASLKYAGCLLYADDLNGGLPTDGETQFVSVWCRVVRGRSDGRILATVWPLYVLHSHLPLDTEVLIVTDPGVSATKDGKSEQTQLPPMLQLSPGRGSSTHLQAPGTTAARHSLSFQYKNIECPVTREAVPLHYGVTDTSVFDKRSPVLNIDDVIKDVLRCSSDNKQVKSLYKAVGRALVTLLINSPGVARK